MAQLWHFPWSPTWPQAVAQSLEICVAFGGDTGHGHQHRLWIQQDYGPRYSPQYQPEYRCHHDHCVAVQVTQVSIIPAARWPADTNVGAGGGLDPKYPPDSQW